MSPYVFSKEGFMNHQDCGTKQNPQITLLKPGLTYLNHIRPVITYMCEVESHVIKIRTHLGYLALNGLLIL